MADHRSVGTPVPLHLIDWRFLLPWPPEGRFRNLVLLGGPVGLAQRVREVGLAQHVSDTIPAERSADAVVALDDGVARLGDIARGLLPGGVLYWEIDRQRVGFLSTSPGRIRRFCGEAGLSDPTFYAVVPNFADHRRMYLPLGIPGPLRWYVTNRYSASTPARHILKAGLFAITGLDGRRFAPFAARLAVTAVAGRTQSDPPSVLGYPALPSELKGHEFQVLLLTSGGDRAVILPFAPDNSEPAAVLKVPRKPSFSGRTENEQTTLRALGSGLHPSLRHSVPQPWGTLRSAGVTVGIESPVKGRLLFCSSESWGTSRRERLDDLRLATEWLIEFHRQTEGCRPSWGLSELSQWVERPIEAYRRTFGVRGQEDRLFSLTREYGSSLAGLPLPIVLQHRDFTVWNVARSGRELAVLDWEGSRQGPALCDLLHFVAHWYETVHRAQDEAARQRCFCRLFFQQDRSDPVREPVYDLIAAYLERLRMSRRFFPVLVVYTWVELALRRAEQQRLLQEHNSDPRTDNRYCDLVAILADNGEQLLSGMPAGAGQERR